MQKDIVEKRLEDHEDVFADVFNTLLFQGRTVLQPEHLEALPTEAFHQDEGGQWRQRWRDVAKKDVKHDVVLNIFGIENQTERDNTMPVRVMGYDFASYNRQVEEKMKENEANHCPAYLKRIHDDQRLAPVITLVLSFDEKGWERPRSVVDLLEVPEESSELLRPYIQDYKMNLVELSNLPEDVIQRFQSDFRFVAEYMTAKSDAEKLACFMADKARVITHPEEFLDMMGAITSDKRYKAIKGQILKRFEREEDVTMCAVVDELEKRGEQRGEQRGKLDQKKIIIRNMLQHGMTDGDVCELADCNQLLVDEVRKSLK